MKKVKRGLKRIAAFALAVILAGTTVDLSTFAVSAAEGTQTVICEHHTEHTADCGYVEAVEGSPCTHVHDETCGDDTVSGNEVCSHVHDEACGYAEAVEGTPCNYVCESCAEEENEEQQENETAECTCGTDDDSIHATNCAVYVAPENPVCTCVEKCTEANVWCDVCGFDYTACTGTEEAIIYEDTTTCTTHTFTDGVCTVCGITGGYCGANTNEGGESSVTWTLKDGTLTISGIGDMADYTYTDEGFNYPWYSEGEFIKTVQIGEDVTSIGNNAFYGCDYLTSIKISDSVESIGINAFSNCRGLTSIEIPNSVTSIGTTAFYACISLTSIEIPNSVTTISPYTFSICSSLTSVIIPNSVTIIDEYAFSGCSSLTSVTIPDSVTSIGSGAFNRCTGLTTVNASCKWKEKFPNYENIDTFAHTRVEGYFANGNKIYYNCVNGCIADDLEAARLELVSDADLHYTGSEITPEVRVVYADDWTGAKTQPDTNNCTYSNNTNPGTATCTFTYAEDCVLTLNFTINKALPDVQELPTVADRTYDTSVELQDSDLIGGTVYDINGNILEGTWSWETTIPIVPKVGNEGYVAVFTPADTNYDTVTATITVNVEKATPDIGTVSAGELQNTLEVAEVVLSRSNTTIDGTLEITDDRLEYGTNTYNWKFTLTGDDAVNYTQEVLTGTVEITVNDTIDPTATYKIGTDGWKQFINTITFGLFCKDYKTVEIEYSDGENGSGIATKQYYISDKEITDTSSIEWKDYTGKINLNATGTYFIYVRVVDNGGNEVILNSEGIVIYAESTISPTNIDYTYKSNADVSVQIALNGNTFAKLTDGEGNEIATNNYTIDDDGKLALNAAYLDTLDVGAYTYKIYMNPQGVETTEVTLAYTFTVNVTAKELTVTGATATSRDYNETNTVEITNVALEGIESSDAVAVDLTGLQGTLSSANAGTYTEVTLPTLTLTGEDAGNYKLVQPTGAVATNVTINKLNPTIAVGQTEYNKTFGDADFTLDVTDDNPEADVTYSSNDENVVTVSNGTVTIKGAGTATITVSLAESANYNAGESKEITVTVAKATYSVNEINKSYLYSRENADSINLAGLLPTDCGTVNYDVTASGNITYDVEPSITDGTLSYTVNSGAVDTEGTITVVVETQNYEAITIKVNVELIDQIPVSPKEGTEVTLKNNTLTYGEALSKLEFNSVVFVGTDGKEVAGTLAWKDADATPNAGTTTATWVFTPSNEEYASLEGTVAITVNKATPTVSAVPTVADRVYNPSVILQNSDLTGGTTSVPGTWSWQTANIIPRVDNSGYVAVFTPSDITNYETVTRTITVNVTKATPHIETAPSAADITYGDTLGSSALSGGVVQYSDTDNTAVAGSFAWKDGNTKPAVSDSNSTTYTVVFTPADTTNYNTVETTITLTVNKAENAPNMPGNTISAPYGNKTVGAVTLPDGWAWQDADKNTALEVGVATNATAVYVGTDKGNYENETVVITITRSVCKHTNTEVRGAKQATCKETGYTGDTYCTDCEECIKTGTEIPLADHKGGTATCTKKAVCSVCGKEYGSVDSSKHNYTGKVTKEPTTTEEGEMTYTCSGCGDTYTEAIDKLVDDSDKPFIKDDEGKEGWDVIRDEVETAKDGDTVTVDMNGTTVVPGDVFDDIKGKDVTIVFDMGNGITWSVNGKEITSDNVADIDFGIKVGAEANDTIPVDVINKVSGEKSSMNVSLSYDGEFGFKAVLSLNMEAKNAGLFANLYYYNETTGELEFICEDKIAADGTVELTFSHASEYVIIIDDNAMETPDSDGVTAPETGDIDNTWKACWLLACGVIALIAAFFVKKYKKA